MSLVHFSSSTLLSRSIKSAAPLIFASFKSGKFLLSQSPYSSLTPTVNTLISDYRHSSALSPAATSTAFLRSYSNLRRYSSSLSSANASAFISRYSSSFTVARRDYSSQYSSKRSDDPVILVEDEQFRARRLAREAQDIERDAGNAGSSTAGPSKWRRRLRLSSGLLLMLSVFLYVVYEIYGRAVDYIDIFLDRRRTFLNEASFFTAKKEFERLKNEPATDAHLFRYACLSVLMHGAETEEFESAFKVLKFLSQSGHKGALALLLLCSDSLDSQALGLSALNAFVVEEENNRIEAEKKSENGNVPVENLSHVEAMFGLGYHLLLRARQLGGAATDSLHFPLRVHGNILAFSVAGERGANESSEDELIERAIAWMDKAAQLGCSAAAVVLALHFHSKENDHEKAKYYLKRAAEDRLPLAQFLHSQMEIEDVALRGAQIQQFALDELLSAAQEKFTPAMTNLAIVYLCGKFDVDKDVSRGIQLLQEAAQLNDARAQAILSLLLAQPNGAFGLAKNEERAVQLLTRAKENDLLSRYIWTLKHSKRFNLNDFFEKSAIQVALKEEEHTADVPFNSLVNCENLALFMYQTKHFFFGRNDEDGGGQDQTKANKNSISR